MIEQLIDMEIDKKSYAILKHTLTINVSNGSYSYSYSPEKLIKEIDLILEDSLKKNLFEDWLEVILEKNIVKLKLSICQNFFSTTIYDTSLYFEIFSCKNMSEFMQLLQEKDSEEALIALRNFESIKYDYNRLLKTFFINEIGKKKMSSLSKETQEKIHEVLS